MLRVLWILSLASLTIGDPKPPSDDEFYKAILSLASSDQPLASSLPGCPAPDSESSDCESSSENQCEYDDSNCHQDSFDVKSLSVAKPGTRDDLKYGLDIEFELPFDRIHVGCTRGIPGEDFPDFVDFPKTSFSCSDQEWLPGYYADLESRCQVFHACLTDRWDSFLCPVGKIFHQKILACDHWYYSKCSSAPHYYSVNRDFELFSTEDISQDVQDRFIPSNPDRTELISQYYPVKRRMRIFPKTSDSKSKTFAKRTERHISTTESRDFAQEPQSTTEATVTEEVQHSTLSPDCPEIIKHINVEAAVRLIFDRLDNLVKDIIRDAKEYKAASDAKKNCSTAHTDEISVSEKMKHKLCTRPLVPPMSEKEEPVITTKTDAAVDPTATADRHKKPVDSRIKRSRRTISPLTKTALIKNYIKLLLKLRKS